jgi:SWI/SNF-related matrix-associated actin-dependent regulator 1 of chromatin subfamily A
VIRITITHAPPRFPQSWFALHPSAYSEQARSVLQNIPGISWVREPTEHNPRGYYVGPPDAIDVAEDALTRVALLRYEGSQPLPADFADDEHVIVPRGTLRPYQQAGAHWLTAQLRYTHGALLADEMGLGKTPQTIAAIDAMFAPEASTVVFCPAVVRTHWLNEFRKWAPQRRRPTVMSYEQLTIAMNLRGKPERCDHVAVPAKRPAKTRKCSKCNKRFDPLAIIPELPTDPTAVVFDELHYTSHVKAKRSEAAHAYLASCTVRPCVIGLTGTPMQARPKDLWHPLNLIWPGRFGNEFAFQKRYCDGRFVEISEEKSVWQAIGSSHQDELAQRLKFCMLRRMKADVLADLPPKIRTVIDVPLDSQKLRIFARFDWTAPGALTNALSLVEEHKIGAAIELVAELRSAGRSVLVLTTRKESARTLAASLGCMFVTGDTAPDDRQLHLVTSAEAYGAGVATIGSVTTGINLTVYDAVVFVGLDWLPSTLLQAEDRPHRIGQKKSVDIFYLIGLGTPDETVREKVIERLEQLDTLGIKTDAALAAALGGSEEDLLKALAADAASMTFGELEF